MSFLADQIRLPPDPPRTFNIDRVTAKMAYQAAAKKNMDEALAEIMRTAGIPNYDLMTAYVISKADWARYGLKDRIYFVYDWLYRECKQRNVDWLK